ncbi:gamma-glutamyl:cysteine ligase YbdK (ATP-grasp superfamily) [Kitasatospora gansuensis]|uniref:Gamma-glutamyl:cysteine ligase YbdK (ATP-grasp superfamily) n=1 Tax=Kitasatospora gansuensis TaxID=258050 RepID=A0A7W7SHH8_9ACTN|nr:nuclear transport factor 2 family protein [Kitasatospora gansuensis]MBB4950583.1 gamma-glutamyl:cysteine ligase YbdK (ATP-grasp superfamily) [Kitasatospora gansuensis]
MTIPLDKLSDPAVRALLAALNANDRAAFQAALTADATLSDDGSERNLTDWTEREIFSSRGHIEVQTEKDDGRTVIANYRNDTWGEMRTAWRFDVQDGRVSRIETGQA